MKEIKKILIPTDFTVTSLHVLRHAMEKNIDSKVDVILAHAIHPPDSITELLFFSKVKLIEEIKSSEFSDACNLLKSKYNSSLNFLILDLFLGNNRSYLENFLKGYKIDEIYIPSNYKWTLPHKLSFDPLYLFNNCSVKVNTFECQDSNSILNSINQVSDLFFSGTKINKSF